MAVEDDFEVEADISFKRQLEIFDPEKYIDKWVTIIGIGNTGSQTALALARLGVSNFEIWDADKVEPHNLSSQSFFQTDKERAKVLACYDQIKKVNPSASVVFHEKEFDLEEQETRDGIFVIATDSMESREGICKSFEDTDFFPDMVIDTRMGGPQLEIYMIRSVETWKEKFFRVPEPDSCGARYVCYISMAMGAFVANQVKRYLNDEPFKDNVVFHIDTYEILAH